MEQEELKLCPVCKIPLQYMKENVWGKTSLLGEKIVVGEKINLKCPICGKGHAIITFYKK